VTADDVTADDVTADDVTDDDAATDHALSEADTAQGPPALRVVRGDPAPEELAALTAVLTASAGAIGAGGAVGSGGAGGADKPATGAWAASTRARRRPPRVGPGAWVMSGRG
jgi:Acyl-CoA carboxylase epsilon subunit